MYSSSGVVSTSVTTPFLNSLSSLGVSRLGISLALTLLLDLLTLALVLLLVLSVAASSVVALSSPSGGRLMMSSSNSISDWSSFKLEEDGESLSSFPPVAVVFVSFLYSSISS